MPDWDAWIESMYRAPRVDAAPPVAELPVETTRAQREYVPAWAQGVLLAALQEQPLATGDLMTRLQRGRNTTQTYLWRLQAAGQVVHARDVWRLADAPA